MRTYDEAEYVASLPGRMRAIAEELTEAAGLPEGLAFDWGPGPAELGITDEELAAEAGTFAASRAVFVRDIWRWWANFRLGGPRAPEPHVRVELPDSCYQSEYGFMVHHRQECRCER